MNNIKIIGKECIGCCICEFICPKKCIKLIYNGEGFRYPEINEEACVKCGKCLITCPQSRLATCENLENKTLYSFSLKDSKVLQSSSGGFYPALAECILNNNGIVYAVELGQDLKAKYIRVDSLDDYSKTQGSKYVQADIQCDLFDSIKKDLENHKVLFVGTPCYCNAVLSMFRNFDNFYTMDFVCHGVPSQLFLDEYIHFLEKKHKGKLIDLNFRDKERNGWSITLKYSILKGTKIRHFYASHNISEYFISFLYGKNLRESCYLCHFCNFNRVSDITVGDFWGYKLVDPSLYNKNGLSFVMVNTKKGKEIFNSIDLNKCNLLQLQNELNDLSVVNTNFGNPTQRASERDKIYSEMEDKGFEYIRKKYLLKHINIKDRLNNFMPNKIKKIIKKIIGK